MKIICTEEEKDELIYELSTYSIENDDCIFMNTRDGRCIGKVNCARCVEDNIEWETPTYIKVDGDFANVASRLNKEKRGNDYADKITG